MCFVLFESSLFLALAFSWNNGLREAVVTRVVFVFEHLIYSSATVILLIVQARVNK